MGLLYVMLAQFFWASELIIIRKFLPSQNAIFISALTSLFGSLFYLPFVFSMKEKLTPFQWGVTFFLGLIAWFIPQIFYVKGIQISQSAFSIALTTLTMPLFSFFLSYIFLKEVVTLRILMGGLLMIAGFLVISTK